MLKTIEKFKSPFSKVVTDANKRWIITWTRKHLILNGTWLLRKVGCLPEVSYGSLTLPTILAIHVCVESLAKIFKDLRNSCTICSDP